jgi:hypothetical protein
LLSFYLLLFIATYGLLNRGLPVDKAVLMPNLSLSHNYNALAVIPSREERRGPQKSA